MLLLLAFTSADIIFHKVLEIHSVLSVKKDFRHEFYGPILFFNGFTQTPHLLNGQNPLSVMNFLSMLPK